MVQSSYGFYHRRTSMSIVFTHIFLSILKLFSSGVFFLLIFQTRKKSKKEKKEKKEKKSKKSKKKKKKRSKHYSSSSSSSDSDSDSEYERRRKKRN